MPEKRAEFSATHPSHSVPEGERRGPQQHAEPSGRRRAAGRGAPSAHLQDVRGRRSARLRPAAVVAADAGPAAGLRARGAGRLDAEPAERKLNWRHQRLHQPGQRARRGCRGDGGNTGPAAQGAQKAWSFWVANTAGTCFTAGTAGCFSGAYLR